MKTIRILFMHIIIVVLLFGLNPANAQILKWANSFGSASSDYSRALAVDSDGNTYVTGSLNGTVDFDPGPGVTELTKVGGNTMFFAKYDKDGGLVWAKQFDDIALSYGLTTDAILDNDENLLIAGKFYGTLDFDPGPGVASRTADGISDDVFVVKLTPDGDFIWAMSLYGTYTMKNHGVDFDRDNNMILSGLFMEKIDFDPGTGHDTLTSTGLENMYVAKYEPDGDYLWAFNVGGDGWSDGSYAHVVDTNGNIYITGLFSSICDFDPGVGTHNVNAATGRVFFASYDKDGNFRWVQNTGGDPIEHMEIDRDQNIYMAGKFTNTFYPDFNLQQVEYNSIESIDIFVGKYDTDGTCLNSLHLGGPGEDHVTDMVLDTFNNIYVSGNFQDSIMVNGVYPGSAHANGIDNIFIVKVDPNNETVWFGNFKKENQTMQEDKIEEIFVSHDGYIYTTGEYSDSLEFDVDTSSTYYESEGSLDMFVAKYSQIPEFVIQPENSSTCDGDTVQIMVRVKGSPWINFTWEQKDGGEWGPVSWPYHGWNSEGDLFMDGVPYSENGNEYRAIAKNQYSADTSGSFILTVNPLPAIDFGPDSSVCRGDTVTLDAGEGFTYLWESDYTERYKEVTETGEHSVVITDIHGCVNSDTILVTVHVNPEVNITASSLEACPEEMIELNGNPTDPEGELGDFVHEWTGDIAYVSDAGIENPAFSSVTPASYQLIYTATDWNGCSAKDTIALIVRPLPAQVDLGNDSVFCGENSTVLRPDHEYHHYLWQDDSEGDTLYVDTTGTYSVRAFNEFGCETRDTVKIKLQYPYSEEVICLVTIDLETGKNLVIWEKTPDVGTAYYNIYRESTKLGKYDSIGTSPYDDLSVFVDETADPESQQYLYKISVVDSCGLESDKSPYHKSLFLQYVSSINGVNLEWSEYEVEGGVMNFETYELYRGTDSTDLTKLTEVSASLDRYSDKDPMALTARYYYRIAGRMPDTCRPAGAGTKADAGPYSHSLSNLEDNRLQTGINSRELISGDLQIYPNPFTHSTMIEFPNPDKEKYRMYVTDLAGKVVYSRENIFTGQVEFERKNLPAGIYIIEFRGENGYRGKLVIE